MREEQTTGRLSELPCSAEGPHAGVVLELKSVLLIGSTPSPRSTAALRLFLTRAATPPRLRRGVLLNSEFNPAPRTAA
jgi:hypothetical protein